MADEKSALEPRRILCVVPDNDTFELLRIELGDYGGCYHLEQVCLAGSALQAARAGDYDLYILDNWWLADGDALELCRRLRCEDPATPVLFYSGNVLPSEIEKAFDAGAHVYITLPDTTGELCRSVEPLISGSEARSRSALWHLIQPTEEADDIRSAREHLAGLAHFAETMDETAGQ